MHAQSWRQTQQMACLGLRGDVWLAACSHVLLLLHLYLIHLHCLQAGPPKQ